MNRFTIFTILAALVAILETGCGRQETKEPESNSASSLPLCALDESNFDAAVQSGVVLVDFWATWCGPCKIQAPIVEEVARRLDGKASFAKVDVDAAPKIAQRFSVQAIPTLIVFKNGKPEARFVGLTKAETLVSGITSLLGSN